MRPCNAPAAALIELRGVGPIVAAKILGYSGDIRRFPGRHHYASYCGTPIEATSGEQRRHRLNRLGNPQLNGALHIILTACRRPTLRECAGGRSATRQRTLDVATAASAPAGGLLGSPGDPPVRICDANRVAELAGNKAIESAAIEWVMELERAAGRRPRDARYQGAPGDIDSPPRSIEVKAFGTSNRGYDLWLETRQIEGARKNPDFYLYVVENVRQGDPALFTLRVLGGARLQHLLKRAKEQHYFTVPWPVADYDSCPTDLNG